MVCVIKGTPPIKLNYLSPNIVFAAPHSWFTYFSIVIAFVFEPSLHLFGMCLLQTTGWGFMTAESDTGTVRRAIQG